MRAPIAWLAPGAVHSRVIVAMTAAMLLAGCGGGSATLPATAAPVATSSASSGPVASGSGNATIDQLIAKVTSAGIDCSDAHATGTDPGATAQVTCGGLKSIEIETFPTPDALTGQFVPYLQSFYCSSSPDTVYLTGGTWAIYALTSSDTITIGKSMGIQPTRLCS